MTNGRSFEFALEEASYLVSEHGENPEYDRAIYELLARMWPRLDYDTEMRATEIEQQIRKRNPVKP